MASGSRDAYGTIMYVYLDMCCLKRPFDDQRQERIRIETEIVLGVVSAFEAGHIVLLRSPAHDLENGQNPLAWRADRVQMLLAQSSRHTSDARLVEARVRELMALGFRNFDALHLAYAEGASAEWFVTCDDVLLRGAKRNSPKLRVPVVSIIEFAQEVFE